MILKRIGPFSAAKVSAVLYAGIGLIVGCFVAVFSLIMPNEWRGTGGMGLGGGFGLAAVIALPLLYGGMGFILGAVSAAIYNVAAGIMGGVEVELE